MVSSVSAEIANPAPAALPVAVPHAEQFDMNASATGRRYRIFLTVPADDPPAGGYPVIYLLDGNATFQTGAETLRLQTRKPKGREPAILVAIGYDTAEPFDVNRRYYDFTTPADDSAMPHPRGGEPWPARGGADAFLAFIKNDLRPEIERRRPIDGSRQTLFGHSLGGFFSLHVLLTDPGAFSTYVAGSPSVWWNRSEIFDTARAFLGCGADMTGKRLLIGIGADEHEDMLAGAREMASLLAPSAGRGLSVQHVEFHGEEHVSVLPALLSRVVSFSLAFPEGALR
ncbi:hypothetical protein LXM94_04915 [Rhizobium sp. TRM95111]|uniref:alpha/beta hydrolase n=1 Tax=Rhizobium alarense TaxID=2846851 RepID=UPI001EEB2B67|nr:alpha/beta hydrolase-fold protein [Rhizobium alarense]MCF3639303.1 hypothetical protein [Rhizobium alarense]